MSKWLAVPFFSSVLSVAYCLERLAVCIGTEHNITSHCMAWHRFIIQTLYSKCVWDWSAHVVWPYTQSLSLALSLFLNIYTTHSPTDVDENIRRKMRARISNSPLVAWVDFLVHFSQLQYLDGYYKVWVWERLGENRKRTILYLLRLCQLEFS